MMAIAQFRGQIKKCLPLDTKAPGTLKEMLGYLRLLAGDHAPPDTDSQLLEELLRPAASCTNILPPKQVIEKKKE